MTENFVREERNRDDRLVPDLNVPDGRLGFPQDQTVEGRSGNPALSRKNVARRVSDTTRQTPGVFAYVPPVMPDSFVERTIEKVERRCERHNVPSWYEVSGGDVHFPFVILDVLQNIDIDDRIREFVRREIGQYTASSLTTWWQFPCRNETLKT